jgi:CHAT domain-containing protein
MSLFPHHLILRGRGFLFCLSFAVLIQTTSRPAGASIPAMSGQSKEPISLALGGSLKQEIDGGDVHTYVFELSEKQFARVVVKQEGCDVALTIFDLAGHRTSVDRPNSSHGREAISFIASQSGAYRLEVRSQERAAQSGRYEISLVEVRPATPRDESRIAAEQNVTEGEALRARKTATSLPQALEKFNLSIALWRALDDPYETAVALYGRCLTQRLLGGNEQALVDCGASADLMHTLGDGYGEAAALTGRAWSYIYLGDTDKALGGFNASLTVRRQIEEHQDVPFDLYGIGWVYALRGDYDQALDYFQQSVKMLESLGEPRGRELRLAAIGEVYRRMNRYPEAVQYLTRSLQITRAAGGGHRGEAETLTSLGWCHYVLGQPEKAHGYFAEALLMRREVGDRTGEANTLLGMAHIERDQGNLYNARLHIDSALSITESLRGQVTSQPLSLSFFALVQDYYEFDIDLLMQLHQLNPSRGYAAAALDISERARARSLLDLLNESGVNVREDVPADLLERERSLRAKLNAAANFQRQLLNENYTKAQAAAAAKDVDEYSTALGETEARIREASPRYAALIRPQPLSADGIRRDVVDSETTLLEFALGKEHSFLWVVTPKGVTAYALPARQEIEAAAVHVRELLTARDHTLDGETPAQKRERVTQADTRYYEAAASLSRTLLAPAAAQLEAKRLVIVATGALQLIPFNALPDPTSLTASFTENSPPLISKHELVTLPSASTLAILRRHRSPRATQTKSVAILADPVFSRDDERFAEAAMNNTANSNSMLRVRTNSTLTTEASGRDSDQSAEPDQAQTYSTLPRLFRTRWESEQIAAMFPRGAALQALDFASNRDTATGEEVSGSAIIHFATHTVINNQHPELSGIALSMFDRRGQPQDGLLRTNDIFNLKLSADLVVLSSCRTLLGHDFRGEGLDSLTRGFMYAGARRVVGSLWSTDDKATAELMVSFYRQMLKANLRPAAALRAAQIEMRHDRRWQSPYFWAGFVMQGDWH